MNHIVAEKAFSLGPLDGCGEHEVPRLLRRERQRHQLLGVTLREGDLLRRQHLPAALDRHGRLSARLARLGDGHLDTQLVMNEDAGRRLRLAHDQVEIARLAGAEAESVDRQRRVLPVVEVRPAGVVHAVADQHETGDRPRTQLQGRLVQRLPQVGALDSRLLRQSVLQQRPGDVEQIDGNAPAIAIGFQRLFQLFDGQARRL